MSSSTPVAHDNHQANPHDRRAHRTPLVAVRGLSETISAGYGNAMLVVRTLDDVSLDVRAGDLVLLSGRVAEGTASLAAVLAGRRRITHGTRALHPAVRVRRGSVSSLVQQAIIDGWVSGRESLATSNDVSETRTAYVLRVRSDSVCSGCAIGTAATGAAGCQRRAAGARALYPTGSWFGWARALCESGGAIVLWSESRCRWRNRGRGAVHERGEEPAGHYGAVQGAVESHGRPGRAGHEGGLRAANMVAGRLIPAATAASAFAMARASVVDIREGQG